MSCIAAAVSAVSAAGLNREEPASARSLHHVDAVVGNQPIVRLVLADRQQRRVREGGGTAHKGQA